MESIPVRSEPKKTTPWLALGLGGMAILLLFAPCLGLIGLAVHQAGLFVGRVRETVAKAADQFAEALQPVIIAMDFQNKLATAQTNSAYGLTTTNFQDRRNRAEFDALLEAHPELRVPWADPEMEEAGDATCTLKFTALLEGGRKVTIRLRLLKEKGQWKIDDILFP